MRALLLTKWRQAAEGKAVFCADATVPEQCEGHWDRAGGARTVPKEPPRVAAIYAEKGVAWLTVCGTTGTGKPYESEFVTQLLGDEVRPVFPVFWAERRFHGVFAEGGDPTRTDQVPSAASVC